MGATGQPPRSKTSTDTGLQSPQLVTHQSQGISQQAARNPHGCREHQGHVREKARGSSRGLSQTLPQADFGAFSRYQKRILRDLLVETSSYSTKDIEGAMPLKSRAEPLSSNSKHTRDEEGKSRFLDDWTTDKDPFPVPKFMRDTMKTSDIKGSSPKPVKKELPSQKYSDKGTPQRAGSVPPRDPLLERLLPNSHKRRGSGISVDSRNIPFRRPLDNSLCRADIPGTFCTPLPEFRRPTNFVEDIAARRSRSRTMADDSTAREFFDLERHPDANKSILKFVQLSDQKAFQAKLKEREVLGESLYQHTNGIKPSTPGLAQARRDRAERHRQKQTTEQYLRETGI